MMSMKRLRPMVSSGQCDMEDGSDGKLYPGDVYSAVHALFPRESGSHNTCTKQTQQINQNDRCGTE